ncbi:hypothetical protein WJX84_007458 [Apatococcus fuscideae]|uniref:Amine oxidase domain-containing protein n=1 Tax=Apatococcus fuscideae TaxID=2026836 RepID=A0AAW1T544_9CHLO
MRSDRKVAVIGSGITGLSAAWLLHRSGVKVTLYEKSNICGGHTWTDSSMGFLVDLGFQVFNLSTYPNFVGFLDQLGVDSEPSDMSFACSVDGGRVEWGSDGLAGIFAQRKNLFSLSHWRMIWDVIRFGRHAPKVLEPALAERYACMSMGEYLQRNGYSRAFQDNYVLPMCAAVWSVPNSQVLAFPVVMLVRFWVNHHLLELTQRPIWRVVKGRSRSYVDRILRELEDVRLGAEVARVTPAKPGGQATVSVRGGSQESFDAVVLATHSDTSLQLLADSAPQGVEEVLRAIPYGTNQVYLHTDTSLMARNRQAWASWNFIGAKGNPETTPVCVSYWVNRLQRVPADAPETFVTLNPPHPPAQDKTALHAQLAHPVFSFASLRAQEQLHHVQGKGGIHYAGAWCGYGFHEDGIRAGIAAAEALGATVPWDSISCNPRTSLLDMFYMLLFTRFARQAISVGHLRIILPNGAELEFGTTPADCSSRPVAKNTSASQEESWHMLPASQATMRLFRYDFFRRIVTRHDVGLGESYMHGDFEVNDLGALLALLTANLVNIQASRGSLGVLNWIGDGLLRLAHATRGNTLFGSRSNIAQHYDAGNAMYKLFLDPSMTYSSAVFRYPGTRCRADRRASRLLL